MVLDLFPSYYFQFPGPGWVNVGVDVLLADWSWKMPAHFEPESLEWMQLAVPREPRDVFSWTGLQQDDVVVSDPLVCVYLPVIKDGIFIARLATICPSPGSSTPPHAAKSPVHRIISFAAMAASSLTPPSAREILAGKGLLTAADCGDATLASLYRLVLPRTERHFSGFDPASGTYYSIALAGPEWFYVTTMSRERLQQQASASARWVLWTGLGSLALVVAVIAAILRGQVTRLLAALTRATKAMSAGNAEVPVAVTRGDELGELAASFREMVGKVAAREG